MAQNKLIKELEETLAHVDLAPFSPLLSSLLEESLAETKQARYRQGTFLMPKLLVWLVLALTMRRDLNCLKVLEWMLSSWRWLSLSLPAQLLSEGAISHARVKMGWLVFEVLFTKLSFLFLGVQPDFHGWRSCYFDGTTLTMPDTPSNRKRFGKHRSCRGASGFPLMRLVTLMMGSAHVILDMAFAPIKGKGTGERTLMMKILQRSKLHHVLFLFDAGFYSYALLQQLSVTQHHFIMKIARSVHVKPLAEHPFLDGGYLAELQGKVLDPLRCTSQRNAYQHDESLVRVIDVQVQGFRPFRLITNLFDLDISALELVRHYHRRWEIELSYDEIKTHQCATLRGQAPTILRSKRADLVMQELYAVLITYNLTRWLIYQTAQEQGINPLHISFLDTLQWIIQAVAHRPKGSSQSLLAAQAYLQQMMAQSLTDRPQRKRSNPRVVKIKMSHFKRKRKQHHEQKIDYEHQTSILPPTPKIQELQEAA